MNDTIAIFWKYGKQLSQIENVHRHENHKCHTLVSKVDNNTNINFFEIIEDAFSETMYWNLKAKVFSTFFFCSEICNFF
jgi:hypothetical protein